MAEPTAAHPLGWKYPISCCGTGDCRSVNNDSSQVRIRETTSGYTVSTTGEKINHGNKKIKNSPDGKYHWCSSRGSDYGKTICLFVPVPST